ncbi:MAG: 50S ribosomal protein L11 methyltransferase [Myxococcota bacterium]
MGVEERSDARGVALIVYVPDPALAGLRAVLAGHDAVRAGRARVDAPGPVPEVDWVEAWKQGLTALLLGDRLILRPSFVEAPASATPRLELVIDPGQAFGTGHHASTRLALECMLDPRSRWTTGQRVLDVGTGTGVLALAALRLGAGRALGLDLDPLSPVDARRWSRVNGLAERCDWLLGPIACVAGARFDWVLANLLRREMEPIAKALAAAVAPGGHLVLSGLLAEERESVCRRFAPLGLSPVVMREERDETGDHWLALVMGRPSGSGRPG